MDAASKQLQALAGDVSDVVKHINDTVFTLALGWAGKTSQEAQDFTNRWNSKMNELFGTSDKPEDGVLNVMSAGVEAAAIGFSQTNDYIGMTFNQIAASLSSPAQDTSTPTSAPPDQGAGTAVVENFPH